MLPGEIGKCPSCYGLNFQRDMEGWSEHLGLNTGNYGNPELPYIGVEGVSPGAGQSVGGGQRLDML